ncbi:AAA family ATPase, partial [Candidatus Pacearchaeota archaeon]|nr:AAA family ATPase [Candidatus Pacearchaeota archaeon]
HLRKIMIWLVSGTDYENIFVDSLTEIAELIVTEADIKYPDTRNGLQKWGHYNKVLKQFIKNLRDFNNYNVVVTCLQKTEKDESSRRSNIPDVSGSLAGKLPQFFDFVFNLRIFNKEDKDVRALMTTASDAYTCKDRSGKLNMYEKPDLQMILNSIQEPSSNENVEQKPVKEQDTQTEITNPSESSPLDDSIKKIIGEMTDNFQNKIMLAQIKNEFSMPGFIEIKAMNESDKKDLFMSLVDYKKDLITTDQIPF